MPCLRRTLLCLMLALPLAACIPDRPVKDKLDTVQHQAACGTRADALVVLLPGIFDTPEDFARERFISALRERNLSVDVIAADAHMGYYRQRTIVERVRQDIVLPARRLGYRQIWLAGVSLGGYGSLLYAKYHAGDIDGIFLIAPYLGNDDLMKEIAAAGGPAGWKAGSMDEHQPDRELWEWMQQRVPGQRGSPPIYIGYGVADRFAPANRMFAGMLPTGHAATTDGGHEWAPWRRLWEGFLDRRLLPACA